jgi:predicted N-acetyltransferase YhbS
LLRSGAGFSLRAEYPALFSSAPGGQSLFFAEGTRILSHVGLLARQVSHSHYSLRLGLIGSVATDAGARGKGLATALLRRAKNDLAAQGCALALLWSEKKQFYSRLGFHPAGQEIHLRLQPQFGASLASHATPFRPEHLPAIQELYHRHEPHLDRSFREQECLTRVPRSRLFVTERAGQITSYLAVHKGWDFDHYVHEWGGELSELVANLQSVRQTYFAHRPLVVLAPGHYTMGALTEISDVHYRGPIGLFAVIDAEKFLAVYRQYLVSRGISHDWDQRQKRFVVGGESHLLQTDEDYLGLILGMEGSPSPVPLPLFLWGFDSI